MSDDKPQLLHGIQISNEVEFFALVNEAMEEKDKKIHQLEKEISCLKQSITTLKQEKRDQCKLWKEILVMNQSIGKELIKTMFTEMHHAFLQRSQEEEKSFSTLALEKLKTEVQALISHATFEIMFGAVLGCAPKSDEEVEKAA